MNSSGTTTAHELTSKEWLTGIELSEKLHAHLFEIFVYLLTVSPISTTGLNTIKLFT